MFNFIFSVIAIFWGACIACAIAASPIKVVVTGAAGRTGGLVLEKLIQSSLYDPVAVVRTEKSAQALRKKIGNKCDVVVADVTDVSCLTSAFTGCKKLVMCTSAVPKIKILSILKVFILKLFQQTSRPEFYFLPNGEPYSVDWLGAKNQIDAAKAAKIEQFVFVSSMGGTQPENFLNTIGRVEGDELSGNILLWKRKAEEYLIKSGVPYTIIHPGGLIDKPGGEREVLLGADDKFLVCTR